MNFSLQQGMQAAINEVFKDVDIYENNISLFTNKFVSPLSVSAQASINITRWIPYRLPENLCRPSFYTIQFRVFGFNGHLYVVLDSTYFVKRAVFNFPKR